MADKRIGVALILSAYDKASAVLNKVISGADRRLASLQARTSAMASKSFAAGQQLVAAGLAVGAPIYKAVEAATEFETKMVDIRKQISALDDPKQLALMQKQIISLGKELPIPISEIQDLIAAGARMDVPRQQLIAYTKDVTKMSIAFDITAGDIGESMGKIAKVFNQPISKMSAMADAINYLDDNAISKGGDIIDVLQRIGGTAKYLKFEQAGALVSTFLTLGETPERAASGINELIVTLSAASVQSNKARAALAYLGLSATDVQKRMTVDAQGTILDVLSRINKVRPDKQNSVLAMLFGQEHIGKIAKLSTSVGEYRRQLALVNGQQKGSMDREYQKRIASTAAQTQLAKNQLRALAITAGNALLPAFNSLLKSLSPIMQKVTVWMQNNPKLVKTLVMGAAVLSGLAITGGYFSFVLGGRFRGFSLVAGGGRVLTNILQFMAAPKIKLLRLMIQAKNFLGLLKGAFLNVGRAVVFVGRLFLTNPILLAITAIAVAAYLVYRNWDKIKIWFSNLWGKVKQIFSATWQWIKNLFLKYSVWGLIISNWSKITAFFTGLWDNVKTIFSNMGGWVKGWASGFIDAGKGIINAIWEGIKSKAQMLYNKVKEVAQKIRNFFPFSPAKDGPLRDIHRIKLIETIATTITPQPLIQSMSRALAGFSANNFRMPSPVPVGSGGGSGMTINFSPTINLSGNSTQQDAHLLNKELKKQFNKLMKEFQEQLARRSF